MTELERLRAQIRAAFPAEVLLGEATVCDCDECRDIRDGVRGRAWDQAGREFIEWTMNPVLMEADGFRAFVPAHLMAALDGLGRDSMVAEMTVYCLCPGSGDRSGKASPAESKRLVERARNMTGEQVAAIRAFLEFVVRNRRDGDWHREMVEEALPAVWRRE